MSVVPQYKNSYNHKIRATIRFPVHWCIIRYQGWNLILSLSFLYNSDPKNAAETFLLHSVLFLGAREIFFVINNFELLLRTFMCPYMFGPNYFTAFNLSLADWHFVYINMKRTKKDNSVIWLQTVSNMSFCLTWIEFPKCLRGLGPIR
jgi:hypothetical protein